MNIWYISAHDQPRGKSSRSYDFARELVRLGHEVTLMTNSYCHWTHSERLDEGEKWRIESIDGIRVIWLKTHHYVGNGVGRGINMITNAVRALQVDRVLGDKPDIVVGPSVPPGTGWAASRIASGRGAAFVYEVRDVWPISLVDDGGLSRSNPVYWGFRLLEKYLYRQADRISATMPFLFHHVEESGGDPAKVKWMPNGVSLDRFEGFETYDGGEAGRLTVMYVGGFGVAHDVISVVHAASILQSKHPGKFRFVIIGGGPRKEHCVAEADRLGLRDVEFRKPIPKAEVPRAQTEADLLLAAVTDSEAYRFGLNLNKIYDYWASARPVVFSGNAPNDPIAESGAGFSVLPEKPEALAEAINRVRLLSPLERQEMGLKGRRYVEEKFDMEVLGKKMAELLIEAAECR